MPLVDLATHESRPIVPVWVVNLALTLLMVSLQPFGNLLEQNLNPYFLQIVIVIGINIILAVSLNLINGITGQFSLGHAGFMAIGAYTTGSLLRHHAAAFQRFDVSGPFFDAMLSAGVISGVVVVGGIMAAIGGLLVGIPSLRLRGDYLAIATLGFGEILNVLINKTEQIGPYVIGGPSGLHGIPIKNNFFLTFAWVTICTVTVWRLAHSTKGKAFAAVREDEVAAAAMGVNTTYYKVSAFVIGAFFAGVAGGLAAIWYGDLDPASFGFMKSIEIVVMVVLGGSGSITGGILSAAILTYLPEQLRFLKEGRLIIYSLLLIGMMLLRPAGLLGNRELWMTRRFRVHRIKPATSRT